MSEHNAAKPLEMVVILDQQVFHLANMEPMDKDYCACNKGVEGSFVFEGG